MVIVSGVWSNYIHIINYGRKLHINQHWEVPWLFGTAQVTKLSQLANIYAP